MRAMIAGMTLTLGLVTAAAVVDGRAAPAPTQRVDIKHFAFAPATITVPVGATVTWTNEDEEPHTITSSSGAFASRGLEYDDTFTQRFRTPGTYTYFCALHPRMTGTVVVR